MKRNMHSLVRLSLLFSAVAFCSASSWAQAHNQFVYVNDDSSSQGTPEPNTLEAFSVASNGALTALPGSPFLTGGMGTEGDEYTPKMALRTAGNFLYVSNDGSSDISIFKINPTTGIPTLSAFGPVPVGGPTALGIGLAVSPDGKFLFADNAAAATISAFSIGPAGGLAPVPQSPFNAPALGIIVTRDSKFVITSDPFFHPNGIGVFAIASNGSLTEVSGSPFFAANEVADLELGLLRAASVCGRYPRLRHRSRGLQHRLEWKPDPHSRLPVHT